MPKKRAGDEGILVTEPDDEDDPEPTRRERPQPGPTAAGESRIEHDSSEWRLHAAGEDRLSSEDTYWLDREHDSHHWQTFRAKQRTRAAAGVAAKQDEKARADAQLRAAVRAHRAKHPSCTRRSIAHHLLPQFGRPSEDRKKAVNALAARIARLT